MARKVGGDVRQLWALIAINVFITFAVPNISWQGHVGGFVGGLVCAGILIYAPRERRTTYQALGLSAVAVVTVAAIIARAVDLA